MLLMIQAELLVCCSKQKGKRRDLQRVRKKKDEME